MDRSPPDLLHLRTLRAAEVHESEHRFDVVVTGQGHPTACPNCAGSNLHRHGGQSQSYIDTPIRGKHVVLHVQRQRYRCAGCGKTLFTTLDEIDPKRLATRRFVRYVETLCLKRTFADLARELGVADKTVRHIFDDYVERLKIELPCVVPEILGIDEVKIVGEYRAMLTNVSEQTLFDMLPTRKKVDLVRYFRALPGKEKVRVVTTDLWSVYRQVIESELPGRTIVADRWHVLRMANEAVEKVRKAIRKTLTVRDRLRLKDDRFVLLARERSLTPAQRQLLDGWTHQFPELATAYRVKEAFHALYECESRRAAELAAAAWLATLPPSVAWAFRETAGALQNWHVQIFNYYDCRISNAYTESINRIGKDINRMGRGYSFEVIRARLLYEDKARVVKPSGVRARRALPPNEVPYGGAGINDMLYTFAVEAQRPKTLFYGTHIPTLCDLLEQGYFED
jgi:transposase